MSITLEQAKQQLRVTSAAHDAQITRHMASALATVQKLVGEAFDADAPDLDIAQLLLIEWYFYPSDKVTIDPITKLPESVIAHAGPYRTPTIA